MSDPKPPVPYDPAGVPQRKVSSHELEAVIRRASELEAAGGGGEEALSEDEVLRIGRELGLSPLHVRQALAEVRGKPPAEPGVVARVMGPGVVSGSRVVQGEAERVRERIERYLLDMEHMVIVRRQGGYTRYERGTGIGTTVRRVTTQLSTRSRYAEFNLKEVDVSVQPLEDGYSLVTLSVDLSNQRAAILGGGLAIGSAMGTAVAVVAGIAVDPVAAILGLPLVGAGAWGARPAFRNGFVATQTRLESFLDRVQQDELSVPPPPDWRKRLGLKP